MSDLQRSLLKKAALTQLPPVPENSTAQKKDEFALPALTRSTRKRDYNQVEWGTYFDIRRDVQVSGDTFRIYESFGKVKEGEEAGPVFVMHHGAGLTALSFAVLVKEIRKLSDKVTILMLRLGKDLRLSTLSDDLWNILTTVYPNVDQTELLLVGHSLGGAVVTHLAESGKIQKLIGLAVIDVVEGTALESLVGMKAYLKTRPSQFPTIEKAIEWNLRSGTIHNLESAKVSVPSLLEPIDPEEPSKGYKWQIDLYETEKYWEEWFTGLSKRFLNSSTAKILILAGTDRLDKELTIAQMQGRFQLLVLPEAGHAIQEDLPDRLALALFEFWKRNDRLILPAKMK
ncbi:protein phosphatase methylesterase [Basidiobolus meristosporus CBS 931.73]|uniref:Protein phosphatase methylesterase 1 n=1 Tax=Basidiobolus meristosporus CBS 931.73 TaxID=1314790 RepID=A0A1Y1XDS4_9FUNG|nr:protein phosphatase methylesterase [Basidiobolus meristosporus CBS 931.73]|eukprot:ORX83910.1 protein phosphatase methylesterase [Basidiobolus meristosporus CBS 931.73]